MDNKYRYNVAAPMTKTNPTMDRIVGSFAHNKERYFGVFEMLDGGTKCCCIMRRGGGNGGRTKRLHGSDVRAQRGFVRG